MTAESFLTRKWNNMLTIGIGLPTLAFAIYFLNAGTISDFWGFITMFVLGAVY